MDNDSRMIRVETIIEHIQYMLARMDKRFDGMEEGFDKLDKKIDALEVRLDSKIEKLDTKIDITVNRLESKMDTNFKWIVGMMITLFVLDGFLPMITKLVESLFSR